MSEKKYKIFSSVICSIHVKITTILSEIFFWNAQKKIKYDVVTKKSRDFYRKLFSEFNMVLTKCC